MNLRPDKSKLKIICKIYVHNHYYDKFEYNIQIFRLEFRKKKWICPIDSDSHEHRAKPFPEGRIQHIKDQIANILTPQEIYEIQIKTWNLFKPVIA